jgi:hypothetical protein
MAHPTRLGSPDRSAAISARNQERLDWNSDHPQPDADEFRRDVLPGLRDRSIRELMAATGLSHPYCAMIRRGAYIPHARHWTALAQLAEAGEIKVPKSGHAAET